MLPQRDTERLLNQHLESLGVVVERQVELTGFTDGVDHVDARLRHPDGREEAVETPWLIGCDGAHSTVRHGMDVAFDGSAQGDDWMLADVRLEGDRVPPGDEIATYLHRDGPFVIFPIPGGRARVIATVGKTDPSHPRPDPTLAEVQAMVDRRAGGGFRVVDPVWLSNFRINERKVSDYARGRVFLAGDAAHVHSPAGGQGMNTGMQDAFNLAWKLAAVMKGRCGFDPARQLQPRADRRGRHGAAQRQPADRRGNPLPPGRASRPQSRDPLLARPAYRPGQDGRDYERDRDRLCRQHPVQRPARGRAARAGALRRCSTRRGPAIPASSSTRPMCGRVRPWRPGFPPWWKAGRGRRRVPTRC